MYCLHQQLQKEVGGAGGGEEGSGSDSDDSEGSGGGVGKTATPKLFKDPGYATLGQSTLSTSNCGNPALRLFGFGAVTPEGYGIGCELSWSSPFSLALF